MVQLAYTRFLTLPSILPRDSKVALSSSTVSEEEARQGKRKGRVLVPSHVRTSLVRQLNEVIVVDSKQPHGTRKVSCAQSCGGQVKALLLRPHPSQSHSSITVLAHFQVVSRNMFTKPRFESMDPACGVSCRDSRVST